MKIYHNDTVLLDITVDDNSYRYRAIKGEHSLTLYYALAEHIEVPVGSYCVFENETYTLEKPESFKMKHSRSFEYTVIFESPQAKAAMFKFRNPVDRRLKFNLTAKPREHLQMFVDNMNMRDSGWTIGECIDAPEKLISYNHSYCIDALTQQAETFETEFEFVGKRVSLRKVEYNKDNPLPLSYGKGNGFKPNIGRSNYEDGVAKEVLFVQGGTENINPSTYGGSELLLPKNQTIRYDGAHFEDEEGFDASAARTYISDADGYSIRRADKTPATHAEDSLDCSEIYPKRVGEVSSVVEVDAGKNFYDFVDTTIPDSLNFNDYLIEGETMTVIFQSGMLAGDSKQFEVKYIHEATDGKAARRFEIVPQEIDGVTMPGGNYLPKAGDTYAVFNCMLPDAYICDNATKSGASWDMFREAVRYLYEHEEVRFSFTGELDGIWAKKDWENIGGRIKLGGYVRFSNEHFQKEPVLVRIIGIKDYINNPHSPEIELSNSPVGGSTSTTLKALENNEVRMESLHKEAIQFTKRRYRDAKETIDMLGDALLENYTNSINPVTVQTMAMLVGDESLQFQFVNNTTDPKAVAHNVVWDGEAKQLRCPAGIIQHLTLGIKSLSSSHAASEYRFWTMEAFTSAVLTESSKKYYLYAKVSKTAQTGVFYMSETAIAMEGVAGYYHLLMGVLNSEYEGARSYVSLYGFSEVLPGRITTDKVVSASGQSFFDMLNNAMKLGDALDFNTQGDGKLRLKGTLVQSQSGDESPVGCYRGVYNSAHTYYNGDEVAFTVSGITSTYRYTNANPAKGIDPTNSAYWQVQAAGVKGDRGIPGNDGADGKDGKDGADGRSSYFHIKYAPVENPTAAQMTETPNLYIGTYVDYTEADSTDPSKYTWARFKGYDGEQGIPGVNGEDGKTSYLHIKYSNDGGQTFASKVGLRMAGFKSLRLMGNGGFRLTDSNLGEVAGEWVGTYVDYEPTDSTDVFRYKWVKVKGNAGDYYEYRYAVNGSTSTPPSLNTSVRTPAGWSTEQPSVGDLQYLWATVAKISGDTERLLQDWSEPVRFTPQDGAKGDSPALAFQGEYDATKTYYGTPYRVDAVRYNGAYYVARTDAGTFYGTTPTDTSKWNTFGAQFESVATLLLLAEYANIGNFVIKNNCLMSQKGTINGVESTDFTNDAFVPNIMLDGLNGQSVISGSIRNPFVAWSSEQNVFNGDIKNGIGRYDNVVMPKTSTTTEEATLTPEQFTWTADNSGRIIRIINYKWSTGTAQGHVILTAPSGKYFYENGKARTQIKMSRECLVLAGYGTPTTFYGWVVLARVDVYTNGNYGAPLKVLYQGVFNPNSTYYIDKLWSEELANTGITETWNIKIISTDGKYRVYLPKYMATSYWHVMLTPCSYGISSEITTNVRYATLMAKGYEAVNGTTYSYFDVWTADDSSVNPGGFLFQIIGIYDWISPTEAATKASAAAVAASIEDETPTPIGTIKAEFQTEDERMTIRVWE